MELEDEPFNCAHCGALAQVDPETGKLFCPDCGNAE